VPRGTVMRIRMPCALAGWLAGFVGGTWMDGIGHCQYEYECAERGEQRQRARETRGRRTEAGAGAMRRRRRRTRRRRTSTFSSSSYEYVVSTRISPRTHASARPSLLMATLPRSGALPSTGTLAFGRHPASATRACCRAAAFSSHDDRTSTARHVLPLLPLLPPERPGLRPSLRFFHPTLPFLSLYPLQGILAAPLRLINPFIVSSIHGCHHNTEGARPALGYAPHGSSPAFEYNRKRAAVAAAAHAGHGWRSVWSAHVEADCVSGRGGERFLGGRTHQPAALAGFAGGY
jgi:hypothetical protein